MRWWQMNKNEVKKKRERNTNLSSHQKKKKSDENIHFLRWRKYENILKDNFVFDKEIFYFIKIFFLFARGGEKLKKKQYK